MFCMDISRSTLLLSSEKDMTTTYWFMEKAYKSGTVPEGYILNNFPKLKAENPYCTCGKKRSDDRELLVKDRNYHEPNFEQRSRHR
jgi:hypothetical protein